MSDILPPLSPDWNNPQPYDGPTHEETRVFQQLQVTADVIREWVAGAYVVGTTPEAWTELGARLAATAAMCTRLGDDQARTIEPGKS
ncbi:hypothetical protein [Kibdelosporangium philippinense]